MEHSKPNYSISVQNHVFEMTNPRVGPGVRKKDHPSFQAIIEKGRQAKAQVEFDQYEARKARRETEIKNAARIRHAEAEANRRRAEESKLSIDDHKGRLLDEMTKNIKALLEDKHREEIRAKVYEDEERIASAYEQDVKDQTKARLVRELEPVVKAELGAEFELEIKQQLAIELISVVKAELRAKHEAEVKQQLAEELHSGVKAELRSKYEEEIKNQVIVSFHPAVAHEQKSTQTVDVDNEPQNRHASLHTLDEESFIATPENVDGEDGNYPDLKHHEHLVSDNGMQDSQQKITFVQKSENTNIDGNAISLPHGIKRFLSDTDDEEGYPYARHSKRSRSTSSNSTEQQLTSGKEDGIGNIYPSNSHPKQTYQALCYNSREDKDFTQYDVNGSYQDIQGNEGYGIDRGTLGSNSFNGVYGDQENVLDHERMDCISAEDVQQADGNLSYGEGPDYDRDEDLQGTNGNCLDREEEDFDSAEDAQGRNGHTVASEAIEFYNSGEDEYEEGEEEEYEEEYQKYEEEYQSDEEEEYEEEYPSEEEERYSTSPQVAAFSNVANGVISFSNTQDTAFVLSDDSEDDAEKTGDEDKTLVGYDGPAVAALIDSKHVDKPVEESLFLDT